MLLWQVQQKITLDRIIQSKLGIHENYQLHDSSRSTIT